MGQGLNSTSSLLSDSGVNGITCWPDPSCLSLLRNTQETLYGLPSLLLKQKRSSGTTSPCSSFSLSWCLTHKKYLLLSQSQPSVCPSLWHHEGLQILCCASSTAKKELQTLPAERNREGSSMGVPTQLKHVPWDQTPELMPGPKGDFAWKAVLMISHGVHSAFSGQDCLGLMKNQRNSRELL